jgi:NitT/TauT family transport system ATP-binding protein
VPPHTATPNAPVTTGARLAGVTKAYRSGGRRPQVVTALDGVDLDVAGGEFVALLGPSGCGKSTVLRILAGLTAADGGTVDVLGGTPEQAAAGRRLGLVPQAPALLPWRSALDNVRLPSQVNRRAGAPAGPDPADLLRSLGLGDALDRRPSEMSGGMQQRVAIARAFVLAPSLLLMDEPFSAVDELTRESLRYSLLDVWQAHRATVVFVTHSVTEAVTLADRVVVMTARPGHIRASVPVELPRPRPPGIELSDAHRRIEQLVRSHLRAGWAGVR